MQLTECNGCLPVGAPQCFKIAYRPYTSSKYM
jgi:hypothetical protein